MERRPLSASVFVRVGVDLIKLIKSPIKSLIKSMRINHCIDFFQFIHVIRVVLYR